MWHAALMPVPAVDCPKREEIAHDASTHQSQPHRHNFQTQLDKGRSAKALPPTAGAPTTADGRNAGRDGNAAAPSGRAAGPGTTATQRAASNALSALTPAKTEAIKREMSRQDGAEVDEDGFLSPIVP